MPAGVVEAVGPKEKVGFAGVVAPVDALAEPVLNSPGPPDEPVFKPENMFEGAAAGLFSLAGVDVPLPSFFWPKLKLPPPLPKAGVDAGVLLKIEGMAAAEVPGAPAGFPNIPPPAEDVFPALPPKTEGAPEVFAVPEKAPCVPPVVFVPKLSVGVLLPLPPPKMFVPAGFVVAANPEPKGEEEAGVADEPNGPPELVWEGFDEDPKGVLFPLPLPPAPPE